MYRLQVKFRGSWTWGIVQYDTIKEANDRVAELAKVGIKARVKTNAEMFAR